MITNLYYLNNEKLSFFYNEFAGYIPEIVVMKPAIILVIY